MAVFTLQALAQNGAAFRHTVPSLKLCSHSVNRAHAHNCEIAGKALGNQPKSCSHKEPVPSSVPEYMVSILRAPRPNFAVWHLEKGVHIGAELRIVPGHQV